MTERFSKARMIAGSLLVAIAVAALIWFDRIGGVFMFMSPDGKVEPYMMLMLRLCLLSLGPVGLAVLFRGQLLRLLARADYWLSGLRMRQFLLWSVGIAFALRLIVVLAMPLDLYADYESYDDLGWQWATKGGYYYGEHLTAYWPPGYPFLLSRLYLLFGHAQQTGVAVNLLLGVSIVLLSYFITRQVFTEKVARWTMIIMALFPSQILFGNLLASEMLFLPLMLAGILVFLSLDKRLHGRWYYALLSGVLIGLAALTRSISQPLMLLVIPYWYFETRDIKRTARYSVLALLGFALVVAPWMVRNHYAVGSAKINTNTGINLFIGNQPSSGMGYNMRAASEFDVNDPTREAEVDRESWARAWEYIFDEPIAFLKRGVLKTGFFYAADMDALNYDLIEKAGSGRFHLSYLLAFLAQAYYYIVLLAAIIGLSVYIRRPEIRSPGGYLLWVTILYWTGLHFLFYGMGRYHFPIIPMIAAFAALYVGTALERQEDSRSRI